VKEQGRPKKEKPATLSDAEVIRRQIFVILAILAVLGGLYGIYWWGEDTGWGNPQRAISMKMAKANQAFINRDLETAISIYERIIRKYPKDDPQVNQALTQLGSAYEEQGDIPKALDAYKRLLSDLEGLPKKDLRAYTLLQVGKLTRQQGDLQGALKTFEMVRTDHPGTDWAGEALSEIGKAWQDEHDYKKATAAYKELIKEMPAGFLAAEAQADIGACLEAQGKDKEAVKAYQVVLDKYPSAVWDQAKARIDYLKKKSLEKKG
jgi:tetratricopeptide (TPR) repeat protein